MQNNFEGKAEKHNAKMSKKNLTPLQSSVVQSEIYHNIELQLPGISFSDPKSLHSRPSKGTEISREN